MNVNNPGIVKEILFKDVLTMDFYWFPLTGFVLSIILFYIYGEFGFMYFGIWGLLFTGLVFFFVIHLLIKYFRKDVLIRFAGKELHIEYNGKVQKYNKEDMVGMFAHDYEVSRSSLISFQLCFKDKKTLEIIDSKFTEKYDSTTNQVLKKNLKCILEELNFSKIRHSKLRAIKKLGAYWYAKV